MGLLMPVSLPRMSGCCAKGRLEEARSMIPRVCYACSVTCRCPAFGSIDTQHALSPNDTGSQPVSGGGILWCCR